MTNEVLTQDEASVHNLRNLRPVVTSHSIDGTFESCPRRFEFMHVWRQLPEGGSSGFAAEVGTCLHEAVQAWARIALLPGRNPQAENRFAVSAGLMTLLRWFPWSLEHVSISAGKAGIKQRSLGETILLYNEIISAEFWRQWDLIDVGDFGLSIEIPWRINHASLGTFPLPDGGYGYLVTQGKIDFILRHRNTREIRVIDLKTTVKDERAHEAAFRFSGQGPSYATVLAHALNFDWKRHGLSMTYVVANFASADGSEDATIKIYTYHYTPDDIQDGIDAKYERLSRMKRFALNNHWTRRQHGCDSFGNPCPYLRICPRRDNDFIKQWFAFEPFEEGSRIYEPIWELIA